MPVINWKPSEDAIIRSHWQTHSQVEIGRLIGRNNADVSRRGKELKLPARCPRWRPDEDAIVRRLYRTHPTKTLARMLNRNVPQVVQRAGVLGVRVIGGRGKRR